MNDLVKIENIMRGMPQSEGMVTSHYYVEGLYARVLFRTAGTKIVGKMHRKQHLYIVAKGKVAVYNAGDDEPRIYQAGDVIVSEPGTKRMVVAIEDSICMTVHHTHKKNLKKIEKELIEPDTKALFDAENKLKELPCMLCT